MEVAGGKGDRPDEVNRHVVDQVHVLDAIPAKHRGNSGADEGVVVECWQAAPQVLSTLPLDIGRAETTVGRRAELGKSVAQKVGGRAILPRTKRMKT